MTLSFGKWLSSKYEKSQITMPKKRKKSLINNLETTLEEEIAKLEKVIKCEIISSDEKIKATESLHNKKTGI